MGWLDDAHQIARIAHIGVGALGLLVFWAPILLRKGGGAHRFAGRVYTWIDVVVLATAAVGAAYYLWTWWLRGLGPSEIPGQYAIMLLLAFLTLVSLALLLQGRGAVVARERPSRLRTPLHLGVHLLTLAASGGLALYAYHLAPPNALILYAGTVLGVLTAYDGLSYAAKASATPEQWVYHHLNGMIGTGVAFYTAFGVFGANRLIDISAAEAGWVSLLPWVLPAAIGVPATIWWKRRLTRGFLAARPV
jgi:hypothetical protein